MRHKIFAAPAASGFVAFIVFGGGVVIAQQQQLMHDSTMNNFVMGKYIFANKKDLNLLCVESNFFSILHVKHSVKYLYMMKATTKKRNMKQTNKSAEWFVFAR